jgi:hypothetical protein
MKWKRKLEVLGYLNEIISSIAVIFLIFAVKNGIDILSGFSSAVVICGLALHGYLSEGEEDEEDNWSKTKSRRKREE